MSLDRDVLCRIKSSASVLTVWYLMFWNRALKNRYLRQTSSLRDYLRGSFGRLRGSARIRKTLPWMDSKERILRICNIFLDCLPLRKLMPFFVNLGFFFDRMIEYSIALQSSSITNGEIILDIGSYYSCFPSYLASHSYTITLDVNRNAMIFQKKVAKIIGRKISGRLECVIADATRLPFREGVFDRIFVISTIEHIEKDVLVAEESGRVLKENASCVISFPFSILARRPDAKPYFTRFYTREMIEDRLVIPSKLLLEELFTFNKTFLSCLYSNIPQGWFILKDLVIGLALLRLEEALLPREREGALATVVLRRFR